MNHVMASTTDKELLDAILSLFFNKEEILFMKSLFNHGQLLVATEKIQDIPNEVTHVLTISKPTLERIKFS